MPITMTCKCGEVPLRADIECVVSGFVTHAATYCGTFDEAVAALARAEADAEGWRNGQAQVQAALDGVLASNTAIARDLAAAQAREVELREAGKQVVVNGVLASSVTWLAKRNCEALEPILSRAPSHDALRAMLERAAGDGAREAAKDAGVSCVFLDAKAVADRILSSEGGSK